jgi:hypothetical protein
MRLQRVGEGMSPTPAFGGSLNGRGVGPHCRHRGGVQQALDTGQVL